MSRAATPMSGQPPEPPGTRAAAALAEFVPEALELLEGIAASCDGPSAREARKLLRQYEPELSKVRAARAPHHSHS